MEELMTLETPTYSRLCENEVLGRNDSNENRGKSEDDFGIPIYINSSVSDSSSQLEIPTYSVILMNPINGPNITGLHLHNDSLHIPDLEIDTESYFLPVLKTFTAHLEVRSRNEYRSCKYTKIVAKNITRIFEVLRAPQLEDFKFQDDLKDYSLFFWKDKTACWERSLVNFIKNHCVSLKRLSVLAWKSSVPPEIQVEKAHPFPELEELSVGFWGHHTHENLSPKNNFWVALLKSQSSQLRKLKWNISCSMSWENIMVPLITKNSSTLESIEMLLPIVASDTKAGRATQESNFIFSIDCQVFCNITQLKTLCLGWQYCFIHNLHFLPRSLQNFSLLSIPVKSCELMSLNNFPKLKQLNLIVPKYCRRSHNVNVRITRKEEYGVTPLVLNIS